jgi:DNA-binding transcriptional ArsR family regulator
MMPVIEDNNFTAAEAKLDELTQGYQAGVSISQLSQRTGIRREAISTVLMCAGIAPSTETRDRVLQHVRENPGLSIDDIALQLDVQKSTVSRHLRGTKEQQLVITRKTGDSTVYPDSAKKAALKEAWKQLGRQEKAVGLSRTKYDELVGNRKDRPSSVTFIRRWGTWTAACERAGIRAVEPRRTNYTQEFSDEDVLDSINRFIEDTGQTTFAAYKAWASKHGFASGALVIIRHGSWSEARRKAMHRS